MPTVRRAVFPVIDPRAHKTLTARMHSEGVRVPDPSQPSGERVVRLKRRQARLYAGSTLAQAAKSVGRLVVTRAFDGARLSGRSAERVYKAELRLERRRRASLGRELADCRSPRRRAEIEAELAVRPKPKALAAAVRIGRAAFDAAHSARTR